MAKPSLKSIPIPDRLPLVVLFAFNRPDLLQQGLDALKTQSVLPKQGICFIDGPRNETDSDAVEQCIQQIRAFNAFPITLVARPENMGCNGNILTGLQHAMKLSPTLVVLEDDVIPSPLYFETMAKLLNYYENTPSIFAILPFTMFQYTDTLLASIKEDVFLTNRFDAWGYATWSNRWSDTMFEKISIKAYNPFGSLFKIPKFPHLRSIMSVQVRSQIAKPDEWSIAAVLYTLHKNFTHIQTKHSMVRNIGSGHPDATNMTQSYDDLNYRYRPDWQPDVLPADNTLHPGIKPLSGFEVITENVRLFRQLQGYWRRYIAVKYLKKKKPK